MTTPSRKALKVAVVGGGIGGLTAALAFHRIGADVRVFERAPEIREAGAGLGVWANAVRVLDRLGVGPALRAASLPVAKVGLYNAAGHALGETDLAELTREIGTPSFVMHRATLQQALLAELPAGIVTTNANCMGFRENARGVTLRFRNLSPFEAHLVIGADGFHSIIRRQLWGDTTVRYSGQHCFRGVVPMKVAHPGLLAEIQGAGRRIGYCPFSATHLYWWACLNAPLNARSDLRGDRAMLAERFKDFPFDLPAAIEATPPEAIIRHDLCDRVPLKRWSRGNVTLLGDAAHPMLPNLGQGACTAIEDAAVLAECVAISSDLTEALALYEALRIPRTTRLVELSWRFGTLARVANPLLVTAREALLLLTPASLLRRELVNQLDYDARAVVHLAEPADIVPFEAARASS